MKLASRRIVAGCVCLLVFFNSFHISSTFFNNFSIVANASNVQTFSLSRDGEKYLTKDFQVKEFAVHTCSKCSGPVDEVKIDLDLVNYLQKIRDHFNASIRINSGYRNREHNSHVSTATESQHIYGKAADIVVSGIGLGEVAKYAETLGMKGIEWNIDLGYVHLDTRDTKWFVKYTGKKFVSVSTFGGTPVPDDPIPVCNCSDSYVGNYYITTNESPLPFRTDHSASSSKVSGCESIPKGAEVYVSKAGTSSGGVTWAHVEYNGYSGYCNFEYLTRKEEPKPDPVPSKPTLTVNAGTKFSMTGLNWNACDNTNWYDIRIYKNDGTNITSIFNHYSTSYTYSLPTGDYYANIASVNSNGKYTFSDDVHFTVLNGAMTPKATTVYNGHVYAVYDAENWYSTAKQAVDAMGGHLATITSTEENQVVYELIQKGSRSFYWLGASDEGSEGNFKWYNGEKFNYTNWADNQPDNAEGKENYLHMYKDNGRWNDLPDQYGNVGFVIEYDGFSEANSGIYNKNMYSVFSGSVSWTEAKAYCESIGGHLAYIGDAKENEYIFGLLSGNLSNGYWIGGTDEGSEGTFRWADGSSLSYDNKDSGQYDNYQGAENYLEMWTAGKWNDDSNTATQNGFICEFESTFSKNLSVDSKTDTEIGISYSGVRYATGYNIYVNGSKIATADSASYKIIGLSPLTSYEIYVEAVAAGQVIGTTDTVEVTTAQEVTFSGKGTASEPYLISSEADLYCMSAMISDPLLNNGFGSKYYRQTDDIVMSNNSFIGIGETSAPFKGIYDGNFHKITNLNGNLFGQIGSLGGSENAIIKNLAVECNIVSDKNAGGIAGNLCGNSVIENSSVTGNITGNNAGGIAGKMTDSASIRNCYHNGLVNSDGISGGIVGIMEGGSIVNTYHTTGNVTGLVNGGIVGEAGEVSIQNSYYLKGTAGTSAGGVAANATVMKELAVTLGSIFVTDFDNINNGYPVLVWQGSRYEFEGNGTESNPYQINSTDDFIQMANYVNSEIFNSTYGSAHYVQNVDIILNDFEWTPIGKHWELPFVGEYDGNNYSIYGLNAGGSVYGGLFGRVGSREANGTGYVHNITVVNGSANCNNGKTGGIVAVLACDARVENCAFIGTISGDANVGGIVGMITEGGSVNNCYQTGTVDGEKNVGGVVGTVDSGNASITNSYHAGGNVTASSQTGGIAGAISSGTVLDNCYYLKTNANYGVNNKANAGAMAVTGNTLKLLADDLGSVYSENISDYFNQGYPVFEWQDFSKAMNPVYGDVNDDGELSIADAVMLQKWLLNIKGASLTNWENADLCEDGIINVFDLALLKRALLDFNTGD